ncbi:MULTISPECIES: conjugal transfer protein TraN [unclassified Thiocapsa]|uniref:conjugal transfer protein TraN n=1 Tax=unclassified Thiocapsa TaxID=2641286 RepID=UPI0035B27079
MLDTFEAIAETFGHCETATTFDNGAREVQVPDLRTCDRLTPQGGSCSWYHDYALPSQESLVTVGGSAALESCGPGCTRVVLERGGSWSEIDASSGAVPVDAPPLEGEFAVSDPARVESIQVTLVFGDRPDHEAAEGWFLQGTRSWYSARFPGVDRARTTPGDWFDATPMTENLRNGGRFSLRHDQTWTYSDQGGPTEACPLCREQFSYPVYFGAIALAVEIRYTSRPLRSVWGANDGCYDLLETLGSDFCSGTVECLGSPPLAADSCYEHADVRICPDAMAAPPVAGQNPFCTEIKVTASCSGFNQGQMQCWTDPQGQLQCPYNDGDQPSDCIALEADPACGFIKSECVEGAVDNRGICFLFEETWDCGAARTIPFLERNRTLDCAGPVRCLGTDCAEFPEEQSADFAKAVGALQTVQMAVSDMQCTPGGSCRVFSGSAHECKRAVGGIVNCCTRPQGVSLADYVGLIFALGKIDAAIMGLDKGAMIRGSWETLRQPVTATWSAVKESFTSVANSFTGKTAAAATDAAAEVGLNAVKQALLKQTAEWAAQLFGDAAVNALFSTTSGGVAVTGGVVAEGSVLQLGGGTAWLGTAMAWAMYAYMIYTVAMILIRIIWTCEQSEFELGAKRELRACHRVGSYCKQEVLTWCVEKRESYCCFNTPLARILNQQIRPQLGRDWGEAQSPECSGIDIRDFARVDWTRVNLDEWLAILYETGHFPTLETLTVEDLTGAGSALTVRSEGRADAATRTVQRSDGLDSEEVRKEAESELWRETLPALPAE